MTQNTVCQWCPWEGYCDAWCVQAEWRQRRRGQLLNHSTISSSSSTVSCTDSWQFSVNVTHRTIHYHRSLVQRSSVPRTLLSLKLTLTSIPRCCQLIWQGLGCWAVSGSADCMIHPDLGPEVCLQWAYSVPYSAVQCSTVGLLVLQRWAGLYWWLGPHSGSGPARRVMQPPAGGNILTF